MQSVPITTKVVSSNPAHGVAYSIQHYVIKFVSDLPPVCGFLQGTPVSSSNKTDCHDINEILLKVVLNTIIPFLSTMYVYCVFLAMLKCPKQLQNFTKNNKQKQALSLSYYFQSLDVNQ
jgi:hypothetical protein